MSLRSEEMRIVIIILVIISLIIVLVANGIYISECVGFVLSKSCFIYIIVP